MALITGVEKASLAERAGIRPGMRLLAINGKKIADVLDYKFYIYDTMVRLALEDENGERFTAEIRKPEGGDVGLDFESYLMDEKKRCSNKCVFCFIDQLPPGMRDTLYFKDDDARMSFLTGNYISLTNLSRDDVRRIINMRISPLNVSVHTTNPELRSFMLGNSRGGKSLEILAQFCEAELAINGQIVVCPGLNDGEELKRTLRDLKAMRPAIKSVSVVPVGLTKHRQGLYPLKPMDAVSAARVIEQVNEVGEECIKEYQSRIFYCADEFFLKAGIEIPQPEYYEDYPQLENGVGMIALMMDEFDYALELSKPTDCKRRLSLATGRAAAGHIKKMMDALMDKHRGIECTVWPIENLLFGEMVDVAGLLSGGDLAAGLEGKNLGEELLISDCMLRHGTDMFLDDMNVAELERRLKTPVRVVPGGGEELIAAVLGENC